MNIEKIEVVLYNCRKALKELHPHMNKDEPCFIYEAYTEAGKLLIELEDVAQLLVENKE